MTFFVTGLLLWASSWDRSATNTTPSWMLGLLIGTVQGIAILPGIVDPEARSLLKVKLPVNALHACPSS